MEVRVQKRKKTKERGPTFPPSVFLAFFAFTALTSVYDAPSGNRCRASRLRPTIPVTRSTLSREFDYERYVFKRQCGASSLASEGVFWLASLVSLLRHHIGV